MRNIPDSKGMHDAIGCIVVADPSVERHALERPVHARWKDASRVWRRMVAAVGAVLVIGIFAFAMTTGLARRLVRQFPHWIETQIVKPPPPKRRTPPPPPKPQLQKPERPTIPPPQIKIRVPPKPRAIKAVKRQVRPPPPPRPMPQVKPQPPPPPPKPVPKPAPKPAPPTPARGIAATHTIPPYPPLARRLGREGTVLLGIVIGADGRVTRAWVAGSSGHSGLDEAARNWVISHWRYKPAMQNGRPVASRAEVKVVFNLAQAR